MSKHRLWFCDEENNIVREGIYAYPEAVVKECAEYLTFNRKSCVYECYSIDTTKGPDSFHAFFKNYWSDHGTAYDRIEKQQLPQEIQMRLLLGA